MNKHEIGFKGLRLRGMEEGDGLTLEGIAVPYGDIIDTWEGAETFDRDCEFTDTDSAKLCYQHGEVIGRITNAQPMDDGLHVTARISATAQGRDAATLISDGVLDSLSVGFIPVTSERDKAGVTHRRKVRLLEVSVVSWPAYDHAKLTDQRGQAQTTSEPEERNTMDEETLELLKNLQDEQRGIKTTLATMQKPTDPEKQGSAWRNQGEYLRALYKGDEQAAAFQREASDLIATGDTGNTATWIRDDIRLIEQRRKVMNILTHEALPATGMTMEYNVVTEDSMQAGKQSAEGEVLPVGKLTFGTKSVNIDTYGGYTSLSRQTIERSTTPMLNTALRALNNAYARNTEQAVRDKLYSLITSERDKADKPNKIDAPKPLASMTPDMWAGLILDAAEVMDDRNADMARLCVSKDVALALISLTDSGSRFMDISGKGSDTLGSFDLTGVVGDLMRVPVYMLPGASTGTAAFIDPSTITCWESGGPTQLTDGDVTKLTNDYSVYGYMAIGVTFSDGLLPVKFPKV